MTGLNKIRIVVVLVGVAVLASACTVKNVYRQMDWVMAGMIEDYIDLSSSQQENLEKRIKAFHQWHQFTQLGSYADDLNQIKQYVSRGLDDAAAEDIFKRIMDRWEAMKQRAAPDMVDMMLTLNDKQKSQLYKNLAEQNEELLEKYRETTQQERNEKAGETMIENFERWLGSLNEHQKNVLKTWPPKFKPVHEDRMAFRLKWQAALKQILDDSGLSEQDKRTRLMTLINTPANFQTEAHREKLVHNSKQFKALILSFDQTVTQAQRAYLADRLDNFIVSFRELAAEKPSK